MVDIDRRTILRGITAGTAGLTATAIEAAEASASGDDSDETTQSDCTTTDDGCGSDDYCPLANTIKVVAETNAGIHYDLSVTGVLELPSGERVSECEGRVERADHFTQFRYSGEIECVSITGRGYASIDQPRPCDPDN